jgi:uncharacterized protein (DUF305 family)
MNSHRDKAPYMVLITMVLLHFLAMYFLMYSMVNDFSNIFPNLNQFYMAIIMTAPMVIMELFFMNTMYHDKKLNILVIIISIFILILFFVFIQQQVGISDEQFLRSMIPHHAAAILMCEKANLHDPEIKELCQNIISSQQSEIDQMKSKLKELGK